MTYTKGLKLIVLVIIMFYLIPMIHRAVSSTQGISDKEWASQVLDQYIRYYCPTSGICNRKNGLERMRRDWPRIYLSGFNILEDFDSK